MPISSSDIAGINANDAIRKTKALEERAEKLEAICLRLCEITLDDARSRDASWHERFDDVKAFIAEQEDGP